MMVYGSSSVIHSYKFWGGGSEKVPVVIEFIDNLNKIRSFYKNIHSELETMKYGCLATFEETNVLIYKSGTKRTFGN